MVFSNTWIDSISTQLSWQDPGILEYKDEKYFYSLIFKQKRNSICIVFMSEFYLKCLVNVQKTF